MFFNHLKPIDGLRAWLALWVVGGHVLAYSGYDDAGTLGGIPKLLREGRLAVDVFMIVSGFVIFLLLDKREENYGQFICRRFFRLYPVYVLLFFVAIPFSQLQLWTLATAPQFYSLTELEFYHRLTAESWAHWEANILLHLGMLHGLPSDGMLGGTAQWAFLSPAWSISLEWQFYLVAPAAYFIATRGRAAFRIGLIAMCATLAILSRHIAWSDGFLPLHVEYFFVGAASYFAYKYLASRGGPSPAGDFAFPAAAMLALMMFLLGGKSRPLIPLCFWLMFCGLLLENPRSLSGRYLGRMFTHPAAQFLGRISYSIYLSHELAIILCQAALAKWMPGTGQVAHFWILLLTTVAMTIPVSAILHRYVEAPGIRLGKQLAQGRRANIPRSHASLPDAPIKSVTST